MRRHGSARLVAAAAAACVVLACSTRAGSRRGAGEGAAQDVRIWVAPILWWEEGTAREVDVALENATNRTVAIAAPDAAHARVEVFVGPESARVCGVAPREPAGTAGPRVELAPGDRVAVRVSLAEACAAVGPGEYRYEVSYRAPAPGADTAGESAQAFSGTIATRYGQLFVTGAGGARPGAASAPRSRPRDGAGAPLRALRPPPGG